MNILVKAIFFATFFYGVFYEHNLLKCFIGFLVGHWIIGQLIRKSCKNEAQKKFDLLKWNQMGDPTCVGKIRVNLDPIDKLLAKYNSKNPKKKLTYTHIGLKSLGYAFS